MAVKGQANLMHIVVGVLVVSSLTLFLFVLRTTTTTDQIDTFTRRQRAFIAEVHLTNLKEATYVPDEDTYIPMFTALGRLCDFEDDKTVSWMDNDHAEEYIESYLNKTIETDYMLEIGGSSCPKFERGEITENRISISRDIMIKIPQTEQTRITLTLPLE